MGTEFFIFIIFMVFVVETSFELQREEHDWEKDEHERV